MFPDPSTMIPSGLAAHTQDNFNQPLVIRCCPGWGWSIHRGGVKSRLDSHDLVYAEITVTPHEFIPFRHSERGGIYGTVSKPPGGYTFRRFLAWTMIDGLDHDFTAAICRSWRLAFSDEGSPDFKSFWFPALTGDPLILGYGAIALTAELLDRRRR